MLLRNAGRVLTRMQLIDRVWGADYVGDTKTLDVHVKRLRAKIEPDPGAPRYLVTVRGLGYKFGAVEPGRPSAAGRSPAQQREGCAQDSGAPAPGVPRCPVRVRGSGGEVRTAGRTRRTRPARCGRHLRTCVRAVGGACGHACALWVAPADMRARCGAAPADMRARCGRRLRTGVRAVGGACGQASRAAGGTRGHDYAGGRHPRRVPPSGVRLVSGRRPTGTPSRSG